MKANRTDIMARIADYISGELDAQSRAEVERYLSSSAPARQLVNSLQSVQGALRDDPIGFEQADLESRMESVSEELMRAVEETEGGQSALNVLNAYSETSSLQAGTRTRIFPWVNRRSPRSSLVFTTLVVAILLVSILTLPATFRPGQPAWNEHYTSSGVHATVRLTDGSSITLTPLSRIKYKEYKSSEPREIHLEGEAYFDVVANSQSPLTIVTKNSLTQVLGTKFSVREFDHDEVTTVAVSTGKVSLKPRQLGKGKELTLSRGDVGHLSVTGVAIVDYGSAVDDHLSWLNGALTFNHSRLQDVILELERWYDVDIVVTEEFLLTSKLTGTLVARSRDEAISRISEALNLHSASNGRTITLSPKGNN